MIEIITVQMITNLNEWSNFFSLFNHKVIINGLDVDYLLPGNDIVINDLSEITIEEKGDFVYVKGKQTR